MSSDNIDPYAYVGLIPNPDGTLTRIPDFLPTCPASSNPKDSLPVLTKDVPINPQTKTIFARLYLPVLSHSTATPTKKLPLIVYFHGGGFILCSAASLMFQNFCSNMASKTPALIVSVDYRLAPEHRLPAAYDDCMDGLHWIKTTNEEWITKYADFSKCFLMGTSAGGNIVYHVGLRVVTCVDDMLPIKIQGLVLHHPFFGGVQRTLSEVRLVNDRVLPSSVTDLMWELCLPIRVDRDHEYCNPTAGIGSTSLEKVKDQGWRVLVIGCDGDPLIDRQIELVKMLQEKGLFVVGEFSDGGFHGCELFHESKAEIVLGILKSFVLSL